MVEFALVIGFVFLLFVGMLQTILFMYAYANLADAAKQGVRYAIVHGTGYTTVNGGVGCSGPAAACTDKTGSTYVVPQVTNIAALSFQGISASSVSNNGCTVSTGSGVNEVDVCYDPNGANTAVFGGPCNAPGCLVSITIAHTYNPLFGLGWPSFNLYATASGRIMN
jgi:Flp pilus assembly protein TadG